MDSVNIKELDEKSLGALLAECGQPAYRAKQLMHWVYEKHAGSIGEITVFSKKLREELSARAHIGGIELVERLRSKDGSEKYLFGLHDGNTVESVLIPDGERTTLCISSQVGCAMGCAFCQTGRAGLVRNLMAYEIADQVLEASRMYEAGRITNIVLMGMGEPLKNIPEVARAVVIINQHLGITHRRITVSTSGVVPGIFELARVLAAEGITLNLAVSLNATTDRVRSEIMPVNRRYRIADLMDACRRYPHGRRRITFEYVMIRGVNDTLADASRLLRLVRGIPNKINLIPLNETEGIAFKRPTDDAVEAFRQALEEGGATALVRRSRGADIMAACGQLSSARKARTGRDK